MTPYSRTPGPPSRPELRSPVEAGGSGNQGLVAELPGQHGCWKVSLTPCTPLTPGAAPLASVSTSVPRGGICESTSRLQWPRHCPLPQQPHPGDSRLPTSPDNPNQPCLSPGLDVAKLAKPHSWPFAYRAPSLPGAGQAGVLCGVGPVCKLLGLALGACSHLGAGRSAGELSGWRNTVPSGQEQPSACRARVALVVLRAGTLPGWGRLW